MRKTKGIIFDLDGVLADSEYLVNQIEVDIKTQMGFPITIKQQINQFTGLAMNDPLMVKELGKLPDDYWDLVDAQKEIVFREKLTTTKKVFETLDQIDLPMSIASNSETYWLDMKVEALGLEKYFSGMAFSRELVGKGKPAPDLFLLAASRMGISPEDCLVVEDSVHGIDAARAANMKVCSYLGASHVTKSYAEKVKSAQPDFVVQNMEEILTLL
jgi:HAD superfamily hydrolase (TIGR01509 family)